jgi:transcription elongation factor Elf1
VSKWDKFFRSALDRDDERDRRRKMAEVEAGTVWTCRKCESVHMVVKWNGRHWTACCEGCGQLYDLFKDGTAMTVVRDVLPGGAEEGSGK